MMLLKATFEFLFGWVSGWLVCRVILMSTPTSVEVEVVLSRGCNNSIFLGDVLDGYFGTP